VQTCQLVYGGRNRGVQTILRRPVQALDLRLKFAHAHLQLLNGSLLLIDDLLVLEDYLNQFALGDLL